MHMLGTCQVRKYPVNIILCLRTIPGVDPGKRKERAELVMCPSHGSQITEGFSPFLVNQTDLEDF